MLCAAVFAACEPATLPALPVSAWGTIVTLAQAEQTTAPAIWPMSDGVVAAWVGTESEGPPFQALRRLSAAGLTAPLKLPLPVRPSAQQLMGAGGDNLHLFWLDANIDNETRLFTALLKPDLTRERESTILTEQATRRYTLLPAGDGGIWAIAAGGLLSEPSLYAHYVDAAGRPRFENIYQIASDADWPAGLRAHDGSLTLFWLRNSDGQVMRSLFADGRLFDPQPISTGVLLNPADRLEDFSAAQDNTRQYLFWNITRADGRRESWMTAGGRAVNDRPNPVRLGVNLNPADIKPEDNALAPFESGFNAGLTVAVNKGNFALSWVKPLAGQFDVLPLAALVDNQWLSIVYLRAGQMVGLHALGIETLLLGPPNLQVDRDLFLYLAWSQPTPAGYADIQLTSLKFAEWEWVQNPQPQ